jgi:MscS family membrane protein
MNTTLDRFRALMTETTFLGNEIWRLATLFAILLLAFVAGRAGRALLKRGADGARAGGRTVAAVFLGSMAASVDFLAYAIGLKAGLAVLVLNDKVASLFGTAADVLFVSAVGWLGYRLVDAVEAWLRSIPSIAKSRMSETFVLLVGRSLRATVAIMVVVQIATVLSDKPAASIIAGLGVGGLALALAAQETVKNLFGSLVILGDRPFEIGERIVVDRFDGPVEKVGFRSTRLRTLDGTLVTIPNGELANKMIQNMDKRPHIRRVANIAVPYATPPEKVRRAREILEEILRNHEGMHPDYPPRVYFNDFNESSLNLILHYWYHPADYWKYMAFSERVNLEILARFNAEGIDFAFPTQTLHLEGEGRVPRKA